MRLQHLKMTLNKIYIYTATQLAYELGHIAQYYTFFYVALKQWGLL